MGSLRLTLISFERMINTESKLKDKLTNADYIGAVDFGRTAKDYGRFRPSFPARFYEKLSSYNIGVRGQKVLDIGCGTGAIARQLTIQDCEVIGLDSAKRMVVEAKSIDPQIEPKVSYVVGRAESLCFLEEVFDVVTAGQCWHWFQHKYALKEIQRILRPGGKLAIAHLDWLAIPGSVASATETLIRKHNQSWSTKGTYGLYPCWLAQILEGGFVGIETFSFDVDFSFTHQQWIGRIRASAGVAASLSQDAIGQFCDDLSQLLRYEYPESVLLIPHRVWAVISNKPTRER
jgi:SAM-dependent methyltransferase